MDGSMILFITSLLIWCISAICLYKTYTLSNQLDDLEYRIKILKEKSLNTYYNSSGNKQDISSIRSDIAGIKLELENIKIAVNPDDINREIPVEVIFKEDACKKK